MSKKVRTSPDKSSPGSERITDPARISRLLEQLARRYTPLTVRISGHEQHYTSRAVAVDSQYVLLDELLPASGHKLLLRERKLKVLGKLDGVDIQFVTALVRVDEQEKVRTYYTKLPGQLEYRQRRQAYRVHVPMSKQLRVFIDINDDNPIEGLLHDLSRGGTGTIVSAADTLVEPGQVCECGFELPDNEWLYCTVELRYSKNAGSQDQQHIGARFIDLSPAQTQLIGRCINELEREFIRKRAAD